MFSDYVADRMGVHLGSYATPRRRNRKPVWAKATDRYSSHHHVQGKTNFFERRVGEYQRAGVMAGIKPTADKNEYIFTTDADF